VSKAGACSSRSAVSLKAIAIFSESRETPTARRTQKECQRWAIESKLI